MTAAPLAQDKAVESAYAHCQELLRQHDKDRYLADLFIPAPFRADAHALHAFSLEIARVRGLVSGPMPGELRHQWWRDVIEGRTGRGAIGNPVAAALIATIERRDLPREALVGLIDARGFDLYDEPMEDLAALASYCGDTSSVLFRLVAGMLAGGPDAPPPSSAASHEVSRESAADEAGLAYAFTGLIGAFGRHAARGQLFLPGDLLRRHGVSLGEALGGHATPGLSAAFADWRGEARRHLEAARLAIAGLPQSAKPAFLPLALVEPYLARTEQRGYDPFHPPPELPQWRRQWALWRG